jgi:DNA-binding transcriptional MerR regulator
MDKSPEAFRTISEVADTLDVPPHVLRFWETRFTQVKPVKRGGGRRYYRPEDVRLLRGIRGLLYDDGMTIKGVQKILRERGIRHVIGLGTLPEPEAPPSPAPAPKPAVVPSNGAHPMPQGDLFDTAPAAVLTAPAAAHTARPLGAPAQPLDKAALKALLAELQALRAVMIADPDR